MKSVRFDEELEAKLERAARALGSSQSEFIREAVSKRCDEVLGISLAEQLAPYIGVINVPGNRASNTGKAFREILAKKRKS